MNLFNCFQAVGFYTLLPVAILWAFEHEYNVWGYIISAILAVGYVLLSISVSESLK